MLLLTGSMTIVPMLLCSTFHTPLQLNIRNINIIIITRIDSRKIYSHTCEDIERGTDILYSPAAMEERPT